MYELLLSAVRPPAPRYPVSAQAVLIRAGIETQVEVRDISTEGLKLAGDPSLSAGDAVVVRLPDQSMVGASVRWTREDRAGLRFVQDLSESQVEAIARG